MNFYTEEQIRQARKVDLLSFLQKTDPDRLVRVSGNTWCLKDHDSFRISNGKWNWFSRGFGGKNAIDYLMTVEGMSFTEALREVFGIGEMPISVQKEHPQTKRKLILPEKNDNNKQVLHYLQGRGIHPVILKYCIDHDLLYESKPYQNAVFIGYDKEHIPRYAAIRSTKSAYKGEATGSDKRFSFSIADPGDSGHLHLFESAIDLLSFATLEYLKGRDWKQDAILSLAGVFPYKREKVLPVALEQFLEEHPDIKEIHLHLDNDDTGRGASQGIQESLKRRYDIWNQPVPIGKDFNDYLIRHSRLFRNPNDEKTSFP